jgi:hypothetical protein
MTFLFTALFMLATTFAADELPKLLGSTHPLTGEDYFDQHGAKPSVLMKNANLSDPFVPIYDPYYFANLERGEIKPELMKDSTLRHLMQQTGTYGENVSVVYKELVTDPVSVAKLQKLHHAILAAKDNYPELVKATDEYNRFIEHLRKIEGIQRVPLRKFYSRLADLDYDRQMAEAFMGYMHDPKKDGYFVRFVREYDPVKTIDAFARAPRPKLMVGRTTKIIRNGGPLAILLGLGIGMATQSSLLENTNPAIEVIEVLPGDAKQ